MKKLFEFNLVFMLPDAAGRAKDYVDALYEAGCDDATIGIAAPGRIGLAFSREAVSAESAIKSAIRDVQKAVKGVRLIEAGPDLVNLSDIADIANFSRQNIQKYASGKIRNVNEPFAPPVVTGSPSLYRLFEVCCWLEKNTEVSIDKRVREISRQAAKLNLKIQLERINSGSA